MFENKLTHNGIHYSRYIVSWKRAGGKIYRGGLFEQWLRENEKLTEEEISDILNLAENGKLELQETAREFMYKNWAKYLKEKKVDFFGGYFGECGGTHFNRLEELYEEACKKHKK